ncbi:hypothetical protein H2200_013154 [Cladophialophora chaetospira]|uniref:Uncharacterized protein n=1 Tax=Cladophialophora chaetospira TaxID=386627 RepID=A0AA39CBG2_9EURO|nr:hypothetical protein H2200_013154 [Cladophialophora chaetospira]
MGTRFEFLPGRGSHYSGKIRSFVLRNKKVRKRGVRAKKPPDGQQSDPIDQQLISLADGKNLLQGELDPFQTMAARVSPIENKMLYHYVEACIPNLGRRTSESFFPPRDIDWQLIRADSTLMSAAVQFAAMSLVYVESTESTPRIRLFAEQARARTLSMLRQRLVAEGGQTSDELLHVFIGVIATDTHIRQGREGTEKAQDNVHLHIKGLRAAMKSRHGWSMAHYHPALQFEFIWQDIVANGEISARETSFSTHLERMLPSNTILPAGRALDEQWDILCALEFVGAYTGFHEMASARVSASNLLPPTIPEPRDLFLPGTAAYETMSSEKASVVRPIAAILLLHILLFEQRASIPEEIIYQYWALRRKFRLCDVELGSGPAYLVYALGMTPDMKLWADQDQMGLLARMLSVEVKLLKPTQQRVKDSLLSMVSASTAQEAEKWLMPDELFNRVHEQLLQYSDQ